MDSSNQSRILRFGHFEVDLRSGELRRNGFTVKLQGQPFQILAMLLERPGELLTREEIRCKLWPADTFVDFDHSLNSAITRLREALGDSADAPRFVETLPRRGYRFIASVDKPGSPVLSSSTPKLHFGRLTANVRWILLGSALLVLLSGIGIWRIARDHTETLPPIEVVPLIGLPGLEYDPAFSADGNQVAFSVDRPGNSGIYTTVVGGEKSLRLTTNSGDCCPRWSPDGRQIAFLRYSGEQVAIHMIPALGGPERRLYSGPFGFNFQSLDWSPDGRVLAFTENRDRTHTWISLLSLNDLTTRRLTSPSEQELDYGPAFSPDGSTVAFFRGTVAGVVADLHVVSAAGGTPRRLTYDNTWSWPSPAWTPDGRDIVISSMRGGAASLWRISASGGTPLPVGGVGRNAFSPSISRKGNQLVYQELEYKNNIWRLNLKDEKNRQGPATVVVSAKGPSLGRPHFSPDGKKIAFESDRFGYQEIWICDSDGSNCGQVTSLHGTAGAVNWSPDSRYIAFEFRPKEHSEVYLLEVGAGVPRLLVTLPGADNGGPSWSRDGKWLYFYSDRGGSVQLWKTQLDGGGSPIQVTRSGGVFAMESADRRFLYYAKLEIPGIWRMPLQGGEETRILDQPYRPFAWWDWALGQNGIYFIDFKTKPNITVGFFEFATRKIAPIWTLATPPFVGLSISADGKSILFAQNESRRSDIVLVKNFR